MQPPDMIVLSSRAGSVVVGFEASKVEPKVSGDEVSSPNRRPLSQDRATSNHPVRVSKDGPKGLAWAAGTEARTSVRATTATVAVRDIDRNIGYPSSNTGPIHWDPAEPTGFKSLCCAVL